MWEWRGAIAIACLCASVTSVAARARRVRTMDAQHGLSVPSISSLAQDVRGFLWIGSVGGLRRYDGQEVRRIAADTLVTTIARIRPARDGSLYVANNGGDVYRVVDEIATPVAGPDGRPLAGIDDIWVEPDGTLWTVESHNVRRRDRDGRWSRPLGDLRDVGLVRGGADGTLYIASSKHVWRVDGTRAVVVAHAERIIDILPATDGSLYVLESHGHLWRAVADTMFEVFMFDTRAITLAQRGGVIWVVYDSVLVSIPPGGTPEVIRREDGVLGGGPILIDREGSLWLGTYAGLQQYPEPDTAVWDVPDGLPPSPRFVVETEEGIWVPTWSGLGRIDLETGKALDTGRNVRGGVCIDGAGHLWGADTSSFIVRIDGKFIDYPAAHVLPNPCDTGPSGRVWFAFRDGVYATRTSGAPELVAVLPDTADLLDTVHEDRHGRVWVSARDLVCWAKLGEPITKSSWQCQRIAGAVALNDFEETEAGTLWAATAEAGVQRWNDAAARWEPVPASLRLASRAILGLAPSPRGGTWILGHGIVLRVRERSDLPGGWEVLEAPSSWNGLPAVVALDALETSNGTLWLAGFGTYQVPASVRGQVPIAPPVTLTDVRVDGERADPDRTLELPYGRNLLQLTFAALSFRDPSLLRYRVRLAADAPWSEPILRPALQLAEIGAGSHVAEISASLDGAQWSPATVLVFEVRGPFWHEPWAIALFLVGLLAVGFVVYRIRTAMQLRLERQRVHIAMDLHDEMGSGLGSIGILASLATNADLPDGKRRTVTAEIIEAAEDLGESLGDIVWSLRRGSNTLDALVSHILERGARLLPDGSAELSTDLPSPVPAVPLSLVVCRSLQLVCFEALYNAARHARAHHVTLGLARAGRRHWRFWIDDDGVGLPSDVDASRPGGGLGLASMRSRADEIGAELRIGERPGGGTRVEVIFDPGTASRSRRVVA
jgi:signal transduction histidine kinase/ligand-binding sensor domain-containing protein